MFHLGADIFVSALGANQLGVTPAIVPTTLDALEQSCQQEFAAIATWNASPMDENKQEEPKHIYDNVAFAPRNPSVNIFAAFFTSFRRSYALTGNQACARSRVPVKAGNPVPTRRWQKNRSKRRAHEPAGGLWLGRGRPQDWNPGPVGHERKERIEPQMGSVLRLGSGQGVDSPVLADWGREPPASGLPARRSEVDMESDRL